MATPELTSLPPGPYVMSISPANLDGSLDKGAFVGHIRRLAAERIGVYVVGAGFGEGMVMSDDDTWSMIDLAVKELKDKTPVVAANLERTNAERNIVFTREAAARGVDAVQVYPASPGHMIVPSEPMFDQFFEDFFAEIKTPVVLSNNMATGFETPLQVHARLLDRYPNIVGFNKYHPSPANLVKFLEVIGQRKPVFTATASLMTSYALGGQGQLDGMPNIIPRTCRAFFDEFQAGNLQQARLHLTRMLATDEVMAGFKGITGSHNLAAHKATLGILGLPGGYPRKPWLPLDDDSIRKLSRDLDELGIRDFEGL